MAAQGFVERCVLFAWRCHVPCAAVHHRRRSWWARCKGSSARRPYLDRQWCWTGRRVRATEVHAHTVDTRATPVLGQGHGNVMMLAWSLPAGKLGPCTRALCPHATWDSDGVGLNRACFSGARGRSPPPSTPSVRAVCGRTALSLPLLLALLRLHHGAQLCELQLAQHVHGCRLLPSSVLCVLYVLHGGE